MRREVGQAPDEEVTILPEADAPTADEDRTTSVHPGRWYSWGYVHDSYAVWKGRRSHRPVAVFGPASKADAERRFKDLESAASVRSARRRSRVLTWGRRVAIGAIIAAIGVGVGALLVVLQGSPEGTDAAPPERAGATPSRYDDPLGAYSVRVPQGWQVVTVSDQARLVSPDGTVSISIETVPAGDLDEAADAFTASAAAAWHNVSLEAPVRRDLGGDASVALGGTALDASGARMRFLAIVVESGDTNHGVLVQVPPEWDAATGFAPIAEIISSLKAG